MVNFTTKNVLLAGIVALGLGACSTTSTKMASKAPITYKVDQGVFAQASYSTKAINPYITRSPRPYAIAPKPVAPAPKPIVPKPFANLPEFDKRKIDTELYAHQRVGNPYKIAGKKYKPKHEPHYDETGIASWYGPKFHGKLTANGEIYDMDGMTAAHKTLPLNSMVRVTNLETGKTIEVRINDRGPFIDGRIIDLSRAAAKELGLIGHGTAKVRVQYAGPADPNSLPGRKAVPAPIMPKKVKPETKPEVEQEQELMVEIPKYKPLRELGGNITSPSSRPSAPEVLPIQPIKPEMEQPNLGQNEYSAPQMMIEQPKNEPKNPVAEEDPEIPEDAEITLTIKGPIHMASSKGQEARLIPAVNYKTLKATK